MHFEKSLLIFCDFFASYAKQDPFDYYFLLNLRPSCILISDSLEKVNNGLHNVAKIILNSLKLLSPSLQSYKSRITHPMDSILRRASSGGVAAQDRGIPTHESSI